MKVITIATLLAVCATPALAQQKAEDHSAHHPAAAASAAELVDGEIRKVDKDAGRLTIRHGEIRSLDMPAMTMVFRVREAGMLDRVKAGDKVRFAVQKADAGYVVTDLQPVQ